MLKFSNLDGTKVHSFLQLHQKKQEKLQFIDNLLQNG